jgi:hypothetical protein
MDELPPDEEVKGLHLSKEAINRMKSMIKSECEKPY